VPLDTFPDSAREGLQINDGGMFLTVIYSSVRPAVLNVCQEATSTEHACFAGYWREIAFMRKLIVFLLAGLAFVIMAPIAHAEQPGRHPAYLHALSDLRHARAHLERRGGDSQVKWDEKVAIAEIDAAIDEIKRASIDDGKNIYDHPPVDNRLDWGGRMHRARELLDAAHRDVKQEEDNERTRGLQIRALRHIDAAIQFVDQGMANTRR